MATLADPSLAVRRGRGKTAFERNLLPGFARWLLTQLEQREPDFLIPVETKGARMLEAVQRYAREELLESIEVPVVYGSALAFIDPDLLRESRVMIVDDAVRTGANLNRHRGRVERYGATVAQAVACIGDAGDAHPKADCYLSVGTDLYREYVWQLTELVVARGLPPEVDHHLFELRLPGRFHPAWWELEALLAGYGTLTVDAPRSRHEDPQPITLHFPALPGMRERPHAGDADEGPCKLRFFPDLGNECVYVVPVSFPALQLPRPDRDGGLTDDPSTWRYAPAVAMERLYETLGRGRGVAETMVDEAKVLDPETIFRAGSTGMEVELVAGLAGLLASEVPGATIRAQREPFDRLYGPQSADALAAGVTEEIESAAAAGLQVPRPEVPAAPEPTVPRIYLDPAVAERTRSIAEDLKAMYSDHAADPDHDRAARVGRSMGEIVARLPDEDPLLASRCVDFGLAMTILVPWVDIDPRLGGAIELQRKYRVSEPGRDDQRPYSDISEVRAGLSAETAAAICHCVAKHSDRYGERPLPRDVLASLVAVLRPLVSEDHSIVLATVPAPQTWEVVLCNDDRPLTIEEDTSQAFVVRAEGVAPTSSFRSGWDADELSLDIRKTSEEVEAHIEMLVPFLDELDPEQHLPLLRGWAMSTDRRLGLTYVRRSLDAALAELRRPLNRILRGEPHGATAPAEWDAAPDYIAAAREKLELLSSDWAGPARERWPDPTKRQRRVLASLGVALNTGVYELPAQLADLIAALRPLVQRLEEASAAAWEAGGEGTVPAAEAALALHAQIHRTLTSLRDEDEVPVAPEDPRAAIEAAADALLDSIQLIAAFVAATASAYRGPRDAHLQPPREERRMASVLSLDLAGSSRHAAANEHRVDHAWKNAGLNLAAQWARAFMGREGKGREGDDIWIEFPVGDAAVLCAAAVQHHVAALPENGANSPRWSFHAAVDAGELEAADGGNTIAACMNRVTRLAKLADEDGETDHVFVAPSALNYCSGELRDSDLGVQWEEVEFGEAGAGGERLRPWAVDVSAAMSRFCERVGVLVESIAEQTPAPDVGEQTLELGPVDEDEPPAAEASAG